MWKEIVVIEIGEMGSTIYIRMRKGKPQSNILLDEDPLIHDFHVWVKIIFMFLIPMHEYTRIIELWMRMGIFHHRGFVKDSKSILICIVGSHFRNFQQGKRLTVFKFTENQKAISLKSITFRFGVTINVFMILHPAIKVNQTLE